MWLSISGYGSSGLDADRVAFGDDAAWRVDLVAYDASGPVFCGDAIADPATGLVASAAVLGALADGGQWLIDVSMSDVAWDLAGPTPSRSTTRSWRTCPRSRPSVGSPPRTGRGLRRRAGRPGADGLTRPPSRNAIAVVGSGMLTIGGSGITRSPCDYNTRSTE